MSFDWNFTKVCSYGSNQQYSSIAADNVLAPARRQAIIWTNDDYVTDASIYLAKCREARFCRGTANPFDAETGQFPDNYTPVKK